MRYSVQGLKERVSWLEDELRDAHSKLAAAELAEKKRKPKQDSLPGVPAHERKQSQQEIDFEYFQRVRRMTLEKLGGYVEDEEQQLAFINLKLKQIREACSSDEELLSLMREYLSDDWAARLKPPFPFRAFTAEKVWQKLLAMARIDASVPA